MHRVSASSRFSSLLPPIHGGLPNKLALFRLDRVSASSRFSSLHPPIHGGLPNKLALFRRFYSSRGGLGVSITSLPALNCSRCPVFKYWRYNFAGLVCTHLNGGILYPRIPPARVLNSSPHYSSTQSNRSQSETVYQNEVFKYWRYNFAGLVSTHLTGGILYARIPPARVSNSSPHYSSTQSNRSQSETVYQNEFDSLKKLLELFEKKLECLRVEALVDRGRMEVLERLFYEKYKMPKGDSKWFHDSGQKWVVWLALIEFGCVIIGFMLAVVWLALIEFGCVIIGFMLAVYVDDIRNAVTGVWHAATGRLQHRLEHRLEESQETMKVWGNSLGKGFQSIVDILQTLVQGLELIKKDLTHIVDMLEKKK